MAYFKRFICLANSVKYGGYCIAGRELLPNGSYGNWIRPVSSRPACELSFMESLYPDNRNPKVLDVIDVALQNKSPHNHQTENHQIDPTQPWRKIGQLSKASLAKLCEAPSSLWINGQQTKDGCNNCVPRDEAAKLKNSLYFIQAPALDIEVSKAHPSEKRNFKYKGEFDYNGQEYSMNLTDPVVLHYLGLQGIGRYHFDNVYLTISLSEPYKWDKRCHKLIAAVMRKPTA